MTVMNQNDKVLEEVGKNLISTANELVEKYPDKNLENHCYLRIAYDNSCKGRWTDFFERPFYKHAPLHKAMKAKVILEQMKTSERIVDTLNEMSLNYRKC